MKNLRKHKKLFPTALILLTLSLLLVQLSPVSAQDEMASLTGVIYDEGVDTDDDGYFNHLNLSVEINVTTPATYRVSVTGIFDSSYAVASIFVENTTYLDAGIHVVYLNMNGTTIYLSELNPYAAAGVNVYDENDTQLDALAEIPLSQEYSYTSFQHEDAQDEMASLTGVIYDEGVDTDDDGYFNYLEIGVEINVTTPATYVVSVAGIHNTTYASYTIFVENTTYLDAGIQVVYLSMDGTSIYVSGIDPTGVKGINIYDDNDTQIDAINDMLLLHEYSYTEFQPAVTNFEFSEVKREIFLDQAGSIYVTNTYRLYNLEYQISDVEIGLPEGAYGVVVRDEMGELESFVNGGVLKVLFREVLNTSEMEMLYLAYRVPWENTVSQQDGINYNLYFTFFEGLNSTIRELAVSVILPKGAEFKSSTPVVSDTAQKDGQDVLVFTFSDVEPSEDDLSFEVSYKHLLFWDSLYPTLWIGIIVVAVSVLSFFWKAPTLSVSPAIVVSSKDLKSFVDSYEEKTRIRSELESLEDRLQKGKIPRRRYKVRRRMLEGRLSALSRTLSSLSDTIRSAGSQYAGMMRQIEVAETNLESAERDLQRVESRYRRGEISKGAYGKLVDEYRSRIEDAESTIDGVLLRLRE